MTEGETTPMAPFVAKDRVIVGASGGEFGIYGWLKGLISKPARSFGPQRNIVPTPACSSSPAPSKPFTTKTRRRPARRAGRKRHGRAAAGAVWGWISYDPDLDLLYYGVGNPAPYNTEQRPGDNKWSNSVLARRPSDGSLVWAYQFTPHDSWDYDAVASMILTEQKIKAVQERYSSR